MYMYSMLCVCWKWLNWTEAQAKHNAIFHFTSYAVFEPSATNQYNCMWQYHLLSATHPIVCPSTMVRLYITCVVAQALG